MIFFREFEKRSEFRGHSTECGGVGAVTCVTCGTLNRLVGTAESLRVWLLTRLE